MSLFGLVLVNSERLSAFILHSMKKLNEFSLSRMEFYDSYAEFSLSSMKISLTFYWALWLKLNSSKMPIDAYLFENNNKKGFQIEISRLYITSTKQRTFCFLVWSFSSIWRIWTGDWLATLNKRLAAGDSGWRFWLAILAGDSGWRFWLAILAGDSGWRICYLQLGMRTSGNILWTEAIPWTFAASETLLHSWKVDQ